MSKGSIHKKRKTAAKTDKHITSLLEPEAEAFQTKLDDATVKDVSYRVNQKSRKEEEELEPEAEIQTPYQMLVSQLCGAEQNVKKRKLDHQKPVGGAKKKRKEELEDNEPTDSEEEKVLEQQDAPDEDWLITKAKLEEDLAILAADRKLSMVDKPFQADDEESEMEVTVAELTQSDPYCQQFDSEVTQTESASLPFNELESTPHGRVWTNADTAIPTEIEGMKHALIAPWNNFFKKQFKKNQKTTSGMTDLQTLLFKVFCHYHDLCFTHQNHKNTNEIRSAYMLHVLNHMLKIRDRVQRHNAVLKKLNQTTPDHNVEHRDQGFTRPRVLILLPTRNDCFEVVEMLIKMIPASFHDRVANKKKFYDEFFEDTYVPFVRKPDDWMARFRGNMDDSFRVGLSFAGKALHLFSEFYSSDIIIASPLGLKLSIAANDSDIDFLSSIEIVVLDSAESHLMQNWEHLAYVMGILNQMPKEIPPSTDITRIRMSYLDGNAKYLRQSLFFSEVEHVDLNSLFKRQCFNQSGKFKISAMSGAGAIAHVGPKVKQHFQRLECNNVAEISEFRFKYFVEQVYTHLLTDVLQGVLLYIPSYFDFVRVRNFFRTRRKKGDLTFVQCCEYSPPNHVARNRSNFFHGERDFMLFTERFHFFKRYAIRGIKKIIFYAPPTFPNFYSEMLNMMPDTGTSMVLFSKFDIYQLEPIVGAKRCARLLTSDKSYHMCC